MVERLGGWHKLIEMLDDDWIWYEKDWMKQYQHYIHEGIPDSTPEYLIGILEIQNLNSGYKKAFGRPGVYIGLEPPMMIENIRSVPAIEHRPIAKQIEGEGEPDDMIPIDGDMIAEILKQIGGEGGC